jgi:hypothetical protein
MPIKRHNNKEIKLMRKALITLVMLGSLSTAAMAADTKVNGNFGYRFDTVEAGTAAKSEKDRMRAELVLESKVNDKVTAVVGLATGGFNSRWNDMGENASLKNVDLHLAYVEYAALDNVKVKLGKMHQPWATSSSLFFDRDVKPEGVAVSFDNGSGLFANASSVKLVEGGAADDSKVQSLQVGLHKKLGGLHLKGAVALHDHKIVGGTDVKLQQAFGEVGTAFAGKPVVAYVDYMKNDEAKKDDTALAYGVKFGNAKKPQEWDLSVFKQDVEANAQYGLWIDSDIAGNTVKHDGYGLTAGYVVLDGWKVNAKYFDVERGASKEDYKRLQLDLIYMF